MGDDERYTPLLGGEHNGVNEKRQASTGQSLFIEMTSKLMGHVVRTVMLNGTIDAQTRDIPVAVDLTFPRPSGATVYYRMKGATFHLIESRLAKDSESPPTNSPSVGPPPHTPIGLIIGVALGGLILFAAIASGILFYRRKHRHQRLEELEPEQYILPNTAAPSPDLPSPEPTISVGGVTPYRYSNLSLPSTSPRAKSGEFHRKQDSNPFASTFRVGDQSDSSSLPPAYIDESVISIPLSTPSASMSRLYVAERQRGTDSVTPSRSNSPSSEPEHIAESRPLKLNTPLAKWAKKNRKYIPERLERKLENAGYVPTDDPDQLTEDEWRRDWGVTIFELGRMRKLYAAKRRKRKQAQS